MPKRHGRILGSLAAILAAGLAGFSLRPSPQPVTAVASRNPAEVKTQVIRRTIHIVVGLDWTVDARQRRWMERACRWAGWPVILRPQTAAAGGAYSTDEVASYLRSGLREAAALLREGRVVVVFPEGYPLIEPARAHVAARAQDDGAMLPFAGGYRSIVQLAERYGAREVAIVPVGFAYKRRGSKWRIRARFGAPMDADSPVEAVESAVRELSR